MAAWPLVRRARSTTTTSATASVVVNAAADPRNGTDWSDVTLRPLHALAGRIRSPRLATAHHGYPNSEQSKAWEIWRDRGAHVSIAAAHRDADAARHAAVPGGAQSRHPAQPEPGRRHEHDHGPVFADAAAPSACSALWPTTWRFRSATPEISRFRKLRHVPPGDRDGDHRGRGSQPRADKVGTLTPGKEADIIVLDARNINTWPMNNVPGTIVTMMNPEARARRADCREGRVLEGQARGLERRALAAAGSSRPGTGSWRESTGRRRSATLPVGLNSSSNPYRPNFLGSCCFKGQNYDGVGVCLEAVTQKRPRRLHGSAAWAASGGRKFNAGGPFPPKGGSHERLRATATGRRREGPYARPSHGARNRHCARTAAVRGDLRTVVADLPDTRHSAPADGKPNLSAPAPRTGGWPPGSFRHLGRGKHAATSTTWPRPRSPERSSRRRGRQPSASSAWIGNTTSTIRTAAACPRAHRALISGASSRSFKRPC